MNETECELPSVAQGTFRFEDVFDAEIAEILKRRSNCGREAEPSIVKNSLSGIALSGGGVRSATFAFGVMQALVRRRLLEQVDYLSTVSGGGYLGAYISSWFRKHPTSELPISSELGSTESSEVQRLRDYASYLAPQGHTSGLTFAALLALGFSINLILISPILIVLALVFSFSLYWAPFQYPLSVTLMLFAVWAVLYAIFVSTKLTAPTQSRPRKILLDVTDWFFIGTATFLFFQFQAPAVYAVHSFGSDTAAKIYYGIAGSFGAVGVAIATMRGIFERFSNVVSRFWRIAMGLLAPLFLWYIVLLIEVTLAYPCSWLYLQEPTKIDILGTVRDATRWFKEESFHCATAFGTYDFAEKDVWRIAAIYLAVAGVTALLSLFVNVNSTSLHTFYRDRLAEAYIFSDARRSLLRSFGTLLLSILPGRVAKQSIWTESVQLSSLSNSGPHQLINAAINIQSSDRNMRGRNAEVFTFSRLFSGSEATGYCPTTLLELADRQLDLATVTAVSGAAFAPNQGRSTNRALRFLMAIANARLGYWLVNPMYVAEGKFVSRKVSPYFFFLELFGRLNEQRRRVYISDGGHIENLGAYELLKRQCRYLIICDAECDPKTTFHGLSHLIRLALIDFGYKIEINLLNVRQTKDFSRVHCAVGSVHYGNGVIGRILYIKPTLTGDEPEYLYEYRSRNPSFPHESTADQFFTEEQFEAYRRLGEHIADEVIGQYAWDWDSIFAELERKYRPRPTEDSNYFAVQAAITKIIAEAAPTNTSDSDDELKKREIYVRKQLEIVETAVIRLRLYSREMANGPYRNLVYIFRKWVADPNFRRSWQTLRREFGAETQAFVDAIQPNTTPSGDGFRKESAETASGSQV
jgi:hypothetical protein